MSLRRHPLNLTALVEPPTNVGAAQQSGITAGAFRKDPNNSRAWWIWSVRDNLRRRHALKLTALVEPPTNVGAAQQSGITAGAFRKDPNDSRAWWIWSVCDNVRRRHALKLGALAATLAAVATLTGCGYKIAGKADTVPRNIQAIYIPPFGNNTVRYKLTDRMPQALGREFIQRTRYRIVNAADEADAILTGSIINYQPLPNIIDPVSQRNAAAQIVVTLSVTLTDKATGKTIFNLPSFSVNERYEISTKPEVYFDESDSALDRVSREVARMVVSAILEGF